MQVFGDFSWRIACLFIPYITSFLLVVLWLNQQKAFSYPMGEALILCTQNRFPNK